MGAVWSILTGTVYAIWSVLAAIKGIFMGVVYAVMFVGYAIVATIWAVLQAFRGIFMGIAYAFVVLGYILFCALIAAAVVFFIWGAYHCSLYVAVFLYLMVLQAERFSAAVEALLAKRSFDFTIHFQVVQGLLLTMVTFEMPMGVLEDLLSAVEKGRRKSSGGDWSTVLYVAFIVLLVYCICSVLLGVVVGGLRSIKRLQLPDQSFFKQGDALLVTGLFSFLVFDAKAWDEVGLGTPLGPISLLASYVLLPLIIAILRQVLTNGGITRDFVCPEASILRRTIAIAYTVASIYAYWEIREGIRQARELELRRERQRTENQERAVRENAARLQREQAEAESRAAREQNARLQREREQERADAESRAAAARRAAAQKKAEEERSRQSADALARLQQEQDIELSSALDSINVGRNPAAAAAALARAIARNVPEADERVVTVRNLIAAHEEAERALLEAPFRKLQGLLLGTGGLDVTPPVLSFDYLAKCTQQWDESRKIGEGTFGDVFLALDPERKLRFVVKKINMSSLSAVSDAPAELGQRMRDNEIVALTKFRSPLIVKLAGFTTLDSRSACLVYEYCAGGALDKALLDDGKANELTFKHRIRIALGVAKALNYLHRGGGELGRCFHRDIKAANICLTATWAPKLIDCGLARVIPEGDDRVAVTATGNSMPGTVGYMCPRYQSGAEKFTEKSELFSFGVVLLELIVGDVTRVGKRRVNLQIHFCPPDPEDKAEELADAFDPRADLDGAMPDAVKTELTALVKSCLKENPTKRIGLQAALLQLRALESAHCIESCSEAMLSAMREERERHVVAEQFKDAAEFAAQKTCSICLCEQPGSDGIECTRTHFFCSSCYRHAVEDELGRIANTPVLAEDHQRRSGQMRCPQHNDGCRELFTDLQLAHCLSDSLFSRYRQLRDEVHAKRVREQAEIDIRRRIERELELSDAGRKRQEEAQTSEMLEQEIRAGRMKRCVNCSVPIFRNGGCDHMHCRGAGGCGAHFCFACNATPSTLPSCPGAGQRHSYQH